MIWVWLFLAFWGGALCGWAFVLWIVQKGLNNGIIVIARGPEWEDRYEPALWWEKK